MHFKIKNCEVSVELCRSFTEPHYDSEVFSFDGGCFTYLANLNSKEVGPRTLNIKLPSDLGAKLTLENCSLSLMKAAGEIKLELRQSQALLLNFEGEIEIDLIDSVMRDIGSNGILRGYLRKSKYVGIQAYKTLCLVSENSSLDLGLTSDAEGVWDISGSGNQITFDANSSSNLMIQSLKDGWCHSGSNSRVFVNINDEEVRLKFSDNQEAGSTQVEIDMDSEQADRLEKSLETIEVNDELMQMFDHFEDQINSEVMNLNNTDDQSQFDEASSQQRDVIQDSFFEHSCVSGVSDRRVMQLYLDKEISLDEMLFALNDKKGE